MRALRSLGIVTAVVAILSFVMFLLWQMERAAIQIEHNNYNND